MGYLAQPLVAALVEYRVFPGERGIVGECQQQVDLVLVERMGFGTMHQQDYTSRVSADDGDSQHRAEAFVVGK